VPLHYYRFFSKRIRFAHGISRGCPVFRRVTSRRQQLRIQPSKRDIEASFLRSTERWSFHHSIEPPDGSGVEFRDELARKARHRQWRRRSRVQNATIRPCQWETSHAIDLIEFVYNSYESIDHDHQPEIPQWTEWSYPWMRPYREPKAKWRDESRVSTVTTTYLPIERYAHTWIALHGQLYLRIRYSSEARLRR